jgi:hypothetical protein
LWLSKQSSEGYLNGIRSGTIGQCSTALFEGLTDL